MAALGLRPGRARTRASSRSCSTSSSTRPRPALALGDHRSPRPPAWAPTRASRRPPAAIRRARPAAPRKRGAIRSRRSGVTTKEEPREDQGSRCCGNREPTGRSSSSSSTSPRQSEVLIRYVAAGLCHSDEHLRHGDIVPRFPIVGGHEGAGHHRGGRARRHAASKEGDHVVCSFLPVCGHCRWCATGHSNICDLGATILDGCLPDGTFRFHDDGAATSAAMCMLGTFSQYSVISETSCVSVDKDLPLETAVLVGCGVPTGWGSRRLRRRRRARRDRDHLRHRRHRRQRRPGRQRTPARPTSSPSTRSPTSARWPRTSAPPTAVASAEEAARARAGADPRRRRRQGDRHRRRRQRGGRRRRRQRDPQGRHRGHHRPRRPEQASPSSSRAPS